MNPAGMDSNRHEFQGREQEEWARGTYAMGSVEHGCFPSYCYGPYPAPLPSYGAAYMGIQPMYVPMMGVSYFVPDSLHDQYEPKPDPSRASRRTRIARRRMHGPEEHSPRPTVDQKPARGVAPLTIKQEIVTNPPLTSAGQWIVGHDSKALMFLLAKQLSPSGVSSLGRIVLPKREAEAHLPRLVASEGVLLTMTDYDTRQSWIFRYRFWSNNKSRMYLLENTRDFVKAHNLQERDTLVLYKDADGSYVVRGEKNGANHNQKCESSPHEAATIEEEISRKQQTLEISRKQQTLEFLI